MIEEWKPIEGYSEYQVSNLGRIKGPRKILNPMLGTFGYEQVNLYHKKAAKTMTVHHLVLAAFIGERPEGTEAHHKDGNKRNNLASNLEWTTRQEHLPKHSSNVLTYEQVQEIRRRYAEGGITQRELAKEFGYTSHAMSNIINNVRRRNK